MGSNFSCQTSLRAGTEREKDREIESELESDPQSVWPPRWTTPVSTSSELGRPKTKENAFTGHRAKLLGHRTRQQGNICTSLALGKPWVSWSHTNTWEGYAVGLKTTCWFTVYLIARKCSWGWQVTECRSNLFCDQLIHYRSCWGGKHCNSF